MKKKQVFSKVCKDIKSIKIQGATNVAKAALRIYYLFPTKKMKKKLMRLRPTEPMMFHVLELADKIPKEKILGHFKQAQEKINRNVFKLIKNGDVIFTHCHSTNAIKALIYAKKHEKKFQVYNTETRPLFQGRKTASELKKAGIKVTMFIDSASAIAIEKENKKDNVYSNLIFLGADAILKEGIINKIGSHMVAELAFSNKIPVYIVADSWKYSGKKIQIEQRKLNEVWDKAPKNIKIKNPAFEFVPKKYIKAIISELGVLSYEKFLNKVKKKNL